MAGSVSIKLKIDGAAEAKAALQSLGTDGSAATAKLRSSLETLSSGDYAGKFADSLAGAAAKVAAAQRALSSAPAGDTAAIAAAQRQVAAATDAYTAALERKRAVLVPSVAAEQVLARTIADTTAAEKLGAISSSEAAAARAKAQSGYDSTIKSMKDVGTSSGAASASMRGLGIQFTQAISGIATGQPVLTTFIQQGHQVLDQSLAMGQGFGGIATAAKGLFAAVGGLPVLLGVSVVGGLAAVGAAAENQAERLGTLRQSLRLTHDDYASLADTVEAGARRVAASSNLTQAAAEDIQKTIASSRYLGTFRGDLDDLTKAAANYARVAGVDNATAGKVFRQALDEPAAAAASLAAQGLPAMTAALLRTITTLDASGEHAKATALVLDTLKTSTKGATDDVSPLSKAMTALGNAFSTTGANGKSFASEIGTFVTNDLAEFLSEITDLVHKAQALRDWVGSKGVTASTPITGDGSSYSQKLLQGAPDTFDRIQTIGQANQIPEAIIGLATRVAYQESKGQQYDTLRDPSGKTLLSSDGQHFGIGQLDAGTAKDMNVDYTTVDGNILGMLKRLYQISQDPRLNANEGTIAGAYNAGPQAMADILAGKRALPDETDRYSQAVAGVRIQPGAAAAAGITLPTVAVSASKSPDSVERALAPFTKLGSEGTPEATQAAAAADIQKYTTAINDLRAAGDTTGPTMDRLQQLLAKARGEFSNAIGPINSVTRGITDQLAPLLAESGAARSVAEALNQQVLAARGAGRTVTDGQAEATRTAVLHNLAAAFNEVVATTDRSTAANLRIAGTLDQGAASYLQATNREKALGQAREDFLPGPEQVAAVDRYAAALNRETASAADRASVQKSFDQRDQLAVLQLETTSLGENADLRDKEITLLQTKQALIKSGADLDSKASRANLANVAAISDATAALKAQQAAYSELTGFVDNTFSTISDSIVSAFATGEQSAVKFRDIAGSVVKAIEAEFLKLALINPLKDLVLGTTSPSLLSVGGLAGTLLGNTGSATAGGSAGAAKGASAFDAPLSTSAGTSGSDGGFSSGSLSAGATLIGSVTSGATSASAGSSFLSSPFASLAGLGTSLYNSVFPGVAAAEAGNAFFGGANGIIGGAGGAATGVAGAAGSIASSLGASNALIGSVTSAVSTVASALPYIGTAISIISSLAKGDVKGASLVGGGALVGSFFGPAGTAIGAAVGGLISSFIPNHPLHPFEDVELNVSGGKLATGKSDGQLADVTSLVSATQTYADGVNKYLNSVGVKISTADGNIGRIGQGITGLAQTLDPNSAFNRLDFANANPDDKSNFSIAKDALLGMKFDTPQALSDELQKIAGFADAASTLGIQLGNVGKDLTNIQIASVSGGNASATTTVNDGNGISVTFLSDLKTALDKDLSSQRFTDLTAIDTEIQKVTGFLGNTLPSLLTPTKLTPSTVQDQVQASNQRYADAMAQSKAYGLNNDQVLSDARDRAIAIIMKPALDAINTSLTSISGRGQALYGGQAGAGQATLANLAQTQDNERTSLYDQIHQALGDNQVATDNYNNALQQLVATQAAETVAVQAQNDITQKSAYASLAASSADFTKRAGLDTLASSLTAYNAKAELETAQFVQSYVAYYGQAVVRTQAFQDQISLLDAAHNAERLQIQTDYNTQSNAALKTAQGSVTSLFGSIKDYALKLQTGSQSTLSPTAQYDLARSQFNAVNGAAQAGDANSASQLTSYADTLLSASQAVNGSGTAYAADFTQVLDALSGITNNTDALTNSFLAQQVQAQTDTLAAAQQATTDAVNTLIREVRQQTRAQAA